MPLYDYADDEGLDYSGFPPIVPLPPEGMFGSSPPAPPPPQPELSPAAARIAAIREYRRRPGGNFITDSTVGRAIGRGAAQLIGSSGDFLDLLGKIGGLGWLSEPASRIGREIGEFGKEISENIPRSAPSLKEISGEFGEGDVRAGISGLATKAVETFAEQIPQIIPSLISAGLFRSLTKGAQLTKEGLRWGTRLAAAAPAAVQEGGANLRGIREETGQDAPWIALGSGITAGALEAITPARLISKFFDEAADPAKKLLWRNIVRATAKEVPKIAGQEFATESSQEVVSLLANKLADQTYKLVTPENVWRVLDAGVSGMLAGAGMGTVNPAVNTAYNKYARADRFARIMADRDRTQTVKIFQQILDDAAEQASIAAKETDATQRRPIEQGREGERAGIDQVLQTQGQDRNLTPPVITQSKGPGRGDLDVQGRPIAPPAPPRPDVGATGVDAIRTLIRSPQAGLDAKTVDTFDAFLQQPVMKRLDWSKLQLQIQDGIANGWQGAATAARSLIELSRNATREVPVHETFHLLHELLPDPDLRQLDELRKAEVKKAISKAEQEGNPLSVRYLNELLKTQHTVDDFTAFAGTNPNSTQYASLRPYAHLMNTSEFLSTLGSEKFSREFDAPHRPIIGKIKEYALALLDALRRVFGANSSFNQLYRELLAGKHEPKTRLYDPASQPFAVPAQPTLPGSTVKLLPVDRKVRPEDAGFGSYWVSPAGEFFRTGDHAEWAAERTNLDPAYLQAQSEIMFGPGKLTPHRHGRIAEEALKKAGWLRVSRERETSGKTVFLDGSPSNPKQSSAVELWKSINSDVEVIDHRRRQPALREAETAFGVAPFRNREIPSVGSLSTAATDAEYSQFREMVNQIAKALGIDIANIDAVGGWFNPEVGRNTLESSRRVEANNPEAKAISLFAAIAGALAPHMQQAVYIFQTSRNGLDTEHAFQFDTIENLENAAKNLNAFNLGDGFSIDNGKVTLYLGDKNNAKFDSGDIEGFLSFAETSGLTDWTTASGALSFPDEGTYRGTLQEARNSGYLQGRTQLLHDLVAQAEAKLDERDRAAASSRQPALARAKAPPPGWAEISKYFTPEELEGKRRDFMKQAVRVFRRINEDQIAAAAKAGQEKLGWYADATRVIFSIFGKDSSRFISILAATSPQNGVRSNLVVALKAWNAWHEAGRPEDWPSIKAALAKESTQLVNFEAWADNLRRAFMGEPIIIHVNEKGKEVGGPKVQRFWLNLLGDFDQATLDLWMARLFRVDQGEAFSRNRNYQIYQAKVRQVAEKMGWSPMEVQETTWSFLKTLWERAKKKGDTLQGALLSLSDEDVASTPDFIQEASDPKVRALLERAGIRIEDYAKHGPGTGAGIEAGSAQPRERSLIPKPLIESERFSPSDREHLGKLVAGINEDITWKPKPQPGQSRQPALAETPARAKAIVEAEGTRGPAAQELAAHMIMGQVGFLERKLQEKVAAATAALPHAQAEAVMNRVGYFNILHTQVIAQNIVPIAEYRGAMQSIPPVLRQTYAKEVAFRFKIAERNLNDVLTEYGKLDQKLQGKAFKNLMTRASASQARAYLLDQMQKFFEADTAQGIAEAKKLLSEVDTNKGGADMLLRVLKQREEKAAHVNAVKSAVADIVNTLAKKEAGINLLLNVMPNSVPDLIKAYVADRDYGRPQEIVIQWAAELIAKARPVTEGLVAMATLNNDRDIRAQYSSLANSLAQAFEKNPQSTARKILSEQRKFATKADRAMAAFHTIQRELMDQLNDWEISRAAAEVSTDVLTDPETQAYKAEVYRDGGVEERPDDVDDSDSPDFTKGIALPDGTTTGKIVMFGDEKDFEKTYQTLNDAIDKIAAWLNSNPDDVTRGYWQRKLDYLVNVLATSRTLAPSKFTKPFNWERFPFGPLGMTKHYADALGTRMAGVLKVSLANHGRAVELAYNLLARTVGKFTNLARAAARSHDLPGNLNRQVSQWFEEIGNPLYSSWQNPEGGLVIGDYVNGHQITRQDFSLMQFVAQTSADGFQIVQRDIAKGREGTTQTVVFKTNIGPNGIPVYVTSSKITENTMPRNFKAKALGWIRGYVDAPDKEAWLNSNFMNVVVRHISDRANTLHDGLSPYEGAYQVIAANVNRSGVPFANRNIDWLVDQVVAVNGGSPKDIKPVILAEFQKMFDRLKDQTPATHEVREATVQSIHPEGPFTKSRRDKLAGDWLYDHGFKNTPDLIQFVLGVQGYYYERAMKDFENVKLDLERQRDEMRAKITDLINQGRTAEEAAKEVVRRQTINVKLGKTFDDYRNLATQIAHTEKITKLFRDIFGGQGNEDFDLGALRRVLGLTTQGVLMSDMVAFRNLWTGWLYIGKSMTRYQGTLLPTAYPKAAWEAAVSGAKFLLSGATGLVKGVARLPTEGVALARISAKDEGWLQSVARFLQPMAEELTHHLYSRIALQREMMARGYLSAPMVTEDVLSRLAAPARGGVVVEEEEVQSLLSRLGNGGMAALAFMFEAPIPIMTFGREFGRVSESILNQAVMKTGMDLVQNLENQLRSAFETWKSAGAQRFNWQQLNDPKNLLTPEEVFGRLMIGERTPTDLEHLKTLFEYSGISFQEAAIRFLAELNSGNQGARLLTQPQAYSVAAQLMQEVNRASVLNRPLYLKKRSMLWQIVAPLMGWNANRLAVDIRQASTPQSATQTQAQVLMAVWIGFILPALAAGAAGDVSGELLMRLIAMRLRGEIRPTRLPWEREGVRSKAIGWVIAAANPIPFVQTIVNLALNDLPQKASASPTIFAQSKILDLIDYIGGVANSGNPFFGLPRLIKGFIPMSGIVINKLPGMEGSIEANNARRLLTRYGPQDLLKPSQIGQRGSADVTPLSPIMEKAVNAIMRDDEREFLAARDQYIETSLKMGKENPERDFAQSFKARNPYNKAFKVRLEPDQREDMLAKMPEGERQMVIRAESRFQNGLELLGEHAGRDTLAMSEGLKIPKGGTRIVSAGGGGGYGGEGPAPGIRFAAGVGGGGGALGRTVSFAAPSFSRFSRGRISRGRVRRPRLSRPRRPRSMVRGYRLRRPRLRKPRTSRLRRLTAA